MLLIEPAVDKSGVRSLDQKEGPANQQRMTTESLKSFITLPTTTIYRKGDGSGAHQKAKLFCFSLFLTAFCITVSCYQVCSMLLGTGECLEFVLQILQSPLSLIVSGDNAKIRETVHSARGASLCNLWAHISVVFANWVKVNNLIILRFSFMFPTFIVKVLCVPNADLFPLASWNLSD